MLNTYYDKFIFTGQIKFNDGNFHLIDIPFFIFPSKLLSDFLFNSSEEEAKKIYFSVKKSTKNFVPLLQAKPKYSGISLVNFVNDFFSSSGFGHFKVIQFDEKNLRAIVSVSESPFAFPFKNRSKKPLDHFLRGIIAGTFSYAFEKDFDCVETKCIAMNSSVCEFIVNSNSEFDFSKKNTQMQLDPKV
ncbi:4-vinyl reductase [Candidatus Micrarchaeota archaeon]|nr:4-vinyl reductase [Candidatus Micrarchaeota archaeon]MBU2476887.1 4-vinyl reductase [Candidatus Micrarchaeota archaeon]